MLSGGISKLASTIFSVSCGAGIATMCSTLRSPTVMDTLLSECALVLDEEKRYCTRCCGLTCTCPAIS